MTQQSFTLIVVPHAKARFRKIQVPVRLAKWSAAVCVAGGIVVSAMLAHYFWIKVEVDELKRLRVENQSLQQKAKTYEQNVGKLQERVVSLQKMVDKLGVMAGLDQPPPGESEKIAGVGGAASSESTAPSLDPGFSLGSMARDVQDLTQRSEKLESFYRDQKILLASTPSVWPVRGYLSSRFGNRLDPFTSQPDFHSGIDISTPLGTKVLAPADGVVVTTAEKGAYGNSIIIDHGYGMVTRYGHLSGYAVRPGKRVKRGEVIGYVGSTGRSQAPHLHYEVWVREQAQNPIHFILDEYRSFG
jgi:murein DD-endopeptidase MepM/ murein hydrolase activator NlpD